MAIDRAIPENGTPSAKRPRPSDFALAKFKLGTSPVFATSNPGNRTTTGAVEVVEEQNREQSTPKGKDESKGPLSLTLVDPDLLDCPICFEPLCSPVYQCENGHISCSSCCTTVLKSKCSNCCLPTGHIRNRVVEQILEAVRVTCQYFPYGCMEVLSYSKKVAHEKACLFVPCSCPCCDFVGNFKCLSDHFALKHKDSSKQFNFNSNISISMDATQKHVILREGKGALFILNRCIQPLGSFFNLVCVAPPHSKPILYELIAKIGDDSIKLKSSVEMVSKWIAVARAPSKMSLVVPSNFVGMLHLELIIGKKKKPPLFDDSDDAPLIFKRRTAH